MTPTTTPPDERGHREAHGITPTMICVVARLLRDEQIVAFGLHAESMLAAAMLAQQSQAPDLRIRHGLRAERGPISGAAAWTSRRDDDSWRKVEYLETHDAILNVANPRSPARFCDVFFVGGMQIDSEGSTNLIGLKGGDGKLAIRGPGSIGTTSIATLAPEVVLFSAEHSRRRFVDTVDYVSVPGWKRRAQAGLGGGPTHCITPMAVIDFEDGRMRLRSVHEGYSVEDVVDATGFELRMAAAVPATQPPTDAELAVLAGLGVAVPRGTT